MATSDKRALMAHEVTLMDSDDEVCAPPPIFEGEPEDDGDDAPRPFYWHDLLGGSGDFCTDKDSTSRWKQMSSSNKAGVSVTTFSRSLAEKGGLCEFLIRGVLPIASDKYFCVNADMEYRPEWDDTCVSLAELSSSGPDPSAGPLVERERVLHWNVNYPWPLGKRDYVLEQTVLSGMHPDGRVFRATQGRTIDPDVGKKLRPIVKGVTRIEDYRAHMAIWSGQTDQESNFALLYFEDGKLNVPTWVLTKAAATTIPAQLAGFVPVAAKYPKKRFQQMLARYALNGPTSGDDSNKSGADDEAFFSASDSESPVKSLRKPPPPPSPVATAASKLQRQISASNPQSPLAAYAAKKPLQSPTAAHAVKLGAAATKLGKTPQPSGSSTATKVATAASKVAADAAKVVGGKRRGSGQAKDKKMASKLEKVLRLALPQKGSESQNPEDSSDEGDLEEGVLIVGKEERDLLLSLLADARANQSGSWLFCCRRRCAGKRRHNK